MGSGTTAIAALKDNRNYVGFEINKDYIKLINKRTLQHNHELKTINTFVTKTKKPVCALYQGYAIRHILTEHLSGTA